MAEHPIRQPQPAGLPVIPEATLNKELKLVCSPARFGCNRRFGPQRRVGHRRHYLPQGAGSYNPQNHCLRQPVSRRPQLPKASLPFSSSSLGKNCKVLPLAPGSSNVHIGQAQTCAQRLRVPQRLLHGAGPAAVELRRFTHFPCPPSSGNGGFRLAT